MNQFDKVFEGKQMRIVEQEDEFWFVAKDVCDILEINNSRQALSRLEEDEKAGVILNDGSQKRNYQAVNEFGLYNLVLSSRKPEAKQFKRWITHGVIPSIRKTGSYSTQPQTQLEILQQSINQMVEQEQRLTKVEKQQENITQILSLNPTEWRKKVNAIIRRIGTQLGGFDAHKEIRNESYERLEDRAKCNLSIRLTNKQRKMSLEGAGTSIINKANKMDVIADDSRLTEIYLAIVKEMAIFHQVDVSELEELIA